MRCASLLELGWVGRECGWVGVVVLYDSRGRARRGRVGRGAAREREDSGQGREKGAGLAEICRVRGRAELVSVIGCLREARASIACGEKVWDGPNDGDGWRRCVMRGRAAQSPMSTGKSAESW